MEKKIKKIINDNDNDTNQVSKIPELDNSFIETKKKENITKIYNLFPLSFFEKNIKIYHNYKLKKYLNNKNKINDKKIIDICNNINNQLLNNIYILKKDIFLNRISINNKYFYYFSNEKTYSSFSIQVNKNSLIKIIKCEYFQDKFCNKFYNINKINLICNIIDLHIDYHHSEILNSFDSFINEKMHNHPIICNNLFNYIITLEQLIENKESPIYKNRNKNENFVIQFDNNVNNNNKILYNTDYIKSIINE
jgi:hypothetical protein